MQVIGVIRLYSSMYDIPIIYTCLPTEAKDFWDDKKIKQIGLWRPGKGHAMDSLRVLLRWRMKSDMSWFTEVLPSLKD